MDEPAVGAAARAVALAAADPLPPAIRARFAAPSHAGALPAGLALRWVGEAGFVADGGWVRLELGAGAGRIAAARFAAYGCPWLLASADWLCEQLEGRAWPSRDGEPLSGLGGPLDWAATLGVPRDRLTRLLLLEDALRAALQAGRAVPG